MRGAGPIGILLMIRIVAVNVTIRIMIPTDPCRAMRWRRAGVETSDPQSSQFVHSQVTFAQAGRYLCLSH